MKKYKLNIKSFLKQANWSHENFGIIAKFFNTNDWIITEDMLEELKDDDK